MITDARVLRQGFVPGDLEHRDAETTYLSDTRAQTLRREYMREQLAAAFETHEE